MVVVVQNSMKLQGGNLRDTFEGLDTINSIDDMEIWIMFELFL